MNTKQSQKFPELQIVELFDSEQDREAKYELLQLVCEWTESYENSVLFYMTKQNWENISKKPIMSFWLLETAE